jgi:hypothetical protein
MPEVLYPPSRPQSAGEALDSAFRIFGATLAKCLPYAVGAVIIGQLPNLYGLVVHHSLLQGPLQIQAVRDPLWWILALIAMCGAMALTNALILRQYGLASGHGFATRIELATGARRVPGLLLIGLLVMLTIVAFLVPVFIVIGAARVATSPVTVVAYATLTGLVLLIPASWVLVRWSCAGTVYLLTDRGALESMGHSWRLTAGSFWRLSLIYTVAILLLLVLYVLSIAITGALSFVFGHGDIAVVTAAAAVAIILLRAVVSPFYCALALAILGELSVRREGADLARRIAAATE